MIAKDIMSSTDAFVSREMKITDLVKFLREKRMGGLPVFDHGKMIGIVTVAEIFHALRIVQTMHFGKLIHFTQLFDSGKKMILVKDIYRPKAVSVLIDTPLEKILGLMIEHNLYSLPVMNKEQTVVYGVIGRHDVTWAVFGT